MFFLISNIVIVLIILFLLYVLSAVWPPDSPWAPWWQMPDIVCFAVARLAKASKKDIVYDLGCGTAKALIVANTKFGAKGIGIEIDPLRALLARWNVWRAQRLPHPAEAGFAMTKNIDVKIIKDNFFNVDLSSATVIYMYLVPNALRRLTPKFNKELKSGTRIVSYVYDLPETYKGKVKLLQHDTKNKIFVYKLL